MPSSPNYVRDYKQEYKEYQGTEEQRHKRSMRNQAHALLEKAYGKEIKKDVDHKVPLARGGNNAITNLQIKDPSDNRSFARDKHARMLSL